MFTAISTTSKALWRSLMMNRVSSMPKLINRIVVALLLGLVGIPSILLGGWFLIIFTVIALPLAVHEFTNARPHNRYILPMHIFIMVMSFSLVYWIFFRNNYLLHGFDFDAWSFVEGFSELRVSTVGTAITVSVLFLSSILNKNFKVYDATYLNTMIILVAMSFQSFLFLRFIPQFIYAELGDVRPLFFDSTLALFVIIATFMTDIGAYFVGTYFGRIKLNTRISERKTWEGFIGGIVISFIVSFTFAAILDMMGYPMLPFLTLSQWYWIVLLSLIIPFVSVLGDLLFSSVKREFQIKNFSTLLGEHGGMLDRIDSLMLTSLYTAILIVILSEGIIAI
jgi:phosphatidate cytidylyltransferase